MDSVQFNNVLLEISNQLSADQLEQIKFLCRGMIGKREQEKIGTGRRLFEALTEKGKLGADNTEFLSQLLTQIQRPDLSDKLNSFESQSGYTYAQPDETEKGNVTV